VKRALAGEQAQVRVVEDRRLRHASHEIGSGEPVNALLRAGLPGPERGDGLGGAHRSLRIELARRDPDTRRTDSQAIAGEFGLACQCRSLRVVDCSRRRLQNLEARGRSGLRVGLGGIRMNSVGQNEYDALERGLVAEDGLHCREVIEADRVSRERKEQRGLEGGGLRVPAAVPCTHPTTYRAAAQHPNLRGLLMSGTIAAGRVSRKTARRVRSPRRRRRAPQRPAGTWYPASPRTPRGPRSEERRCD
jgi:hypothetical protein